jgi:hypothetical protein
MADWFMIKLSSWLYPVYTPMATMQLMPAGSSLQTGDAPWWNTTNSRQGYEE